MKQVAIAPGRLVISREEARRRGLKSYFTSIPCRNGHVAERWTRSGMCFQCSRENWPKRYAKKLAALAPLLLLLSVTVAGAQCADPGTMTASPPNPAPPTATITVDTSNPVAPTPGGSGVAPVPDTTNLVAPVPGTLTCGGPPPPPPPPVDGVCGSASGVASATAPTTNLCSSGTASLVTSDGTNWNWTCAGSNGGATATCTAPVAPPPPPPPVNGVCGSAAGVATSSPPAANLCSAGTATTVSGDGTNWNWTCTGSNGGTDANCSAPELTTQPGTETIGETTVFPDTDGGNRGLLLVQDAVLATDGTLQTLSMYAVVKGGSARFGLYKADGPNGGPGTLVAQTASFIVVLGWNTHPVMTPVAVTAGNYWLAYTPSSNYFNFPVERDYGQCWWANRTYQAMPAKFPRVVGMDQCHWALYGTLSVP